ncbi:hypothetical protein HYPBUDRAFT_244194 [Hyphopichia burtonii NRRL Y-1933]|uniref:Kinetochore protein NDC80 n=1 Tax=Hyphopichia burtonii NRRL Y-1933 TaxID=984485 RepID=A0A1E4RDH0_9ASCO|nr:hypothetical protein HYPBUDRAFT_244194 [Hyphopichia burtonii NRRL Y-1933]ODV65314.1 hypothetical protein HYPBUDRAFT_244194 [Hyphopichia burtonii NRRL Y-1933]
MSETPILSSVRRTSKRLSMAGATRASLNGPLRSSGLFDSIVNSNNSNGSAKRSILLSTPANGNKRRRSSIYHQQSHPPSLQSSANVQSSVNAPSSQQASSQVQLQQQQQQPLSGYRTDPRPLRDKNYQALIQQEIYDFLSKNRFELEMNHTLTTRTLRQPTQKDFVLIFQFLYGKLDPNYKFTKSIQTEVTNVLKMLNYPYLDGINRSQITAVGGSNWPAILGMLYWLVKVNLSFLNINDDELMLPDDPLDVIYVKNTTKAYQLYINQEDLSNITNQMNDDLKIANEKLIDIINNLNSNNQDLLKEYEELNFKIEELKTSEDKSKALESDLIKFQAYLETMESRKLKWSEILNKIQLEINNCEEDLSKLNEEKKDIESKLINKGFTINDIDNLNNERDKISKLIDNLSNKFEDLKNKLNSKDIELNKNYQSLDNFIKQYNNTIYKIPSINYNFEIQLNEGILSDDNFLTIFFKPNDIINKTLKDEKIELLKFRSQLNNKIHQDQDDVIKLQEQGDLISETILEQRESIENLEAKLNANKITYDEIYETMISDTTAYSLQIEKLDRELRSIKINTNQGIIEIENNLQNLSIEFDELNHEIFKQKSILHDKIQKIIEFIINFKINIQSNLENLDDLITEELKIEQNKKI